MFDLDDIDAAFAELDARYLAGEAAGHAESWSEITQSYAAMNRHEIPATMSEWTTIDHRVRETFEGGDLTAYARSAWELMPNVKIRIEAVHRLSDRGVVATHVAHGTSQDGFEAEWRMIALLLVQPEGPGRCELFNESDLDAALARFDELHTQKPRLENAATRIWAQLADTYDRRDEDGFLSLATPEGSFHDSRRGFHSVLAGPALRRNLQAILDVSPSSWRMNVDHIAIRGSRLSLTRPRWVDSEHADRPITVEALTVMEVDDSGLMHDLVIFDIDDVDAAFAELDARYLAGEAGAHAHTWSVIAQSLRRVQQARVAGHDNRTGPKSTTERYNDRVG